MAELTLQVEQLASEFRHLSDRERLERENLILQLENGLLKLQKQLPQGKPRKKK